MKDKAKKGYHMHDFLEGMHKVGDAMAAAISAQVTKEAQEKRQSGQI